LLTPLLPPPPLPPSLPPPVAVPGRVGEPLALDPLGVEPLAQRDEDEAEGGDVVHAK
jgi:hypothetical protein